MSSIQAFACNGFEIAFQAELLSQQAQSAKGSRDSGALCACVRDLGTHQTNHRLTTASYRDLFTGLDSGDDRVLALVCDYMCAWAGFEEVDGVPMWITGLRRG